MYKISELISMPVISIYESECVGIISNLLFDYKHKKCKYAIVLDEKNDICKTIKMQDIYKVGEDCVFIKNNFFLQLSINCNKEMEEKTSPINTKIYNLDGQNIGITSDIILNNKFEISDLIISSGAKISSKDIINIGDIIITDNKKLSINKFKPQQKIVLPIDTETKVIILSDSTSDTNKVNLKTTSNDNLQSPIENSKIITDYRFLIGRTLIKNIVATNGEIIAKKDSTITKNIVNKASICGKLVEIARYSTNNTK